MNENYNEELMKLREEHPWLKKHNIGLYLDSEYYERFIPPFNFDGKNDEEYLDSWLNENYPNMGKTLELACGTGRMTKILNKYAQEIVGVDKSPKMLEAAKQKFEGQPQIHLFLSDAYDYINRAIETEEISTFDSITSFWGINYMLHHDFIRIDYNGELIQALKPEEIKRAEEIAIMKLRRLLDYSKSGARYIFFHVRSDTDEQIINRKYWGRFNPLFKPSLKTPSQRIIEKVLSEYKEKGRLQYNIKHVDGTVRFNNLETALETFLNFHSKGYFNNRPECVSIFKEMEKDLLCYRLPNGEIELGAGFLLIDISKK